MGQLDRTTSPQRETPQPKSDMTREAGARTPDPEPIITDYASI